MELTPEQFDTVRGLFDEALLLPPQERDRYLRERAGDPALAEEILRLVAGTDEDDSIAIAGPVVELAEGVAAQSRINAHAGCRLGAYELIREVGRGGMAVVYEALRRDGTYEKRVAVKFLLPEVASDAMIRIFNRERELLARLEHPGISRLYDGGVSPGGEPYYVMEFIDGLPVTAYIRRMRLSLEQRLHLFCRICEAVSHAHRNEVAHLDIKPGNLLVSAQKGVKLMDFSIARQVSPDAAAAGAEQMFTPDYASPEQLAGGELGFACDIYSLGVLLYEFLAEVRPFRFQDRTREQVLEAIHRGPLPPSQAAARFGRSRPLFARDLDGIVLKAMRSRPEQRYASVEELRKDVERFLLRRPVSTRPRTAPYLAARFIHRNLARFAVSCAGVFAAGAVAAALSFGMLARAEGALAETRLRVAVSLVRALPLAESGTPDVRASVKLLDALGPEAARDGAIAREFAAAYVKLGDMQEDAAAARSNYARAANLLRRLPGGAADPLADCLVRRGRPRP